MNSNRIVLAALAALGPVFAAHAAQAASATITHAWIRKLPGAIPAGGYFELHNNSDRTLVLTGASSPACASIMLHKSENMGGMEEMTMVDSIKVAPHATLAFAPGGYHLMCTQPHMEVHDNVPVTLSFEGGKPLSALFVVRDAKGE